MLEWKWRPSPWLWLVSNIFLEFRVTTLFKKLTWCKTFYKPCSKTSGLSIYVPYWFVNMNIRHCKLQQPDCYDFSAVTSSIYITHTRIPEKTLVGISPIGIELMFFSVNVLPGSISDSNITEKNLMWLAGLRKNMKSCQIKGSLNSSCQKNNPVFRNWRSC